MPGERHEAAEGPEAGDRGEHGGPAEGDPGESAGSRGPADSEHREAGSGPASPGPEAADGSGREKAAPAAGAPSASEEEDRRSRPDIRAARTETRLRRWALLLLVLVPVVYFLYQRFS